MSEDPRTKFIELVDADKVVEALEFVAEEITQGEIWKSIDPVIKERYRQVYELGYTAEADDEYTHGELLLAAESYIRVANEPYRVNEYLVPEGGAVPVPTQWPWDSKYWKPHTKKERLVIAAALILAEIGRLEREPVQMPVDCE